MKENTNIEDLFKQKFENFEANVDPSVWANVSQSINTAAAGSAAGTGAGLSGIAKVAIITATVAATSVGVWYFTKDSDAKENSVLNEEVVVQNNENNPSTVSIDEENIQVSDTNDPVLQENRIEIQEGLSTTEISPEQFDEELIDILIENQNSTEQPNTVVDNGNTNESNESTEDHAVTDVNNEQDDEVNNETEVEVKKLKTDLQYQVDGSTLTFNSGAKNHISVEWNFGDDSKKVCDKGSHTYKRPGSYVATMKVVGENNTKTIEFPVEIEGTSEISEIPNVITPNNDGANDYFFIRSKDIEEFSITIYNMNGEVVFTSEDPDFRWYGESPDGEVRSGKYLFKILAVGTDGAIYKEAKMLNIAK